MVRVVIIICSLLLGLLGLVMSLCGGYFLLMGAGSFWMVAVPATLIGGALVYGAVMAIRDRPKKTDETS